MSESEISAPVTWREIMAATTAAVYEANLRWPHTVPYEVASATAGLVRRAVLGLHRRHVRNVHHCTMGPEGPDERGGNERS